MDKVPSSSGYDLIAVADQSFAYFWPISQTLLYRELDRLSHLGWVTATRVIQTRAPSKWTYQARQLHKRGIPGAPPHSRQRQEVAHWYPASNLRRAAGKPFALFPAPACMSCPQRVNLT
jgi:hypothetical protein